MKQIIFLALCLSLISANLLSMQSISPEEQATIDTYVKSGESYDQGVINAVIADDAAAVDLFLRLGANPNGVTVYKKDAESFPIGNATPLIIAAIQGDEQITQALVDNGAHVNAQDDTDKNSPLIHAAKNDHNPVAQILFEKHADPNIQNKWGDTALMIAAQRGNQQMVEMLLDNGADPNIQNRDGHTALMNVAGREKLGKQYLTILQMIIDHGAQLDLQTRAGKTALDQAIWFKGQESMEILESAKIKQQQEAKAKTYLFEEIVAALQNLREQLHALQNNILKM